MTKIETIDDVLIHARLIFETAPFLVDLALALCDEDRRCMISMNLDKDHEAINKIEWPA